MIYHSVSIHLGHLGYSQIFIYYETIFYEHCILCFFVNRGFFSGINAQELDCMISTCLVCEKLVYFFSVVTVPTYIHTNSVGAFPFLDGANLIT